MREASLLASLGWHPSLRWGLAFAAGAVLGGTLTTEDGAAHDVTPGIAASVSGSLLALTETSLRPFLLFGLSVAASQARTDGQADLSAVDVRASGLVGKTFFDAFTPYGVARGFTGPVRWDRLEGSGADAHHFAIGLGATLRLPSGLDVVVEGIPLGERSVTFGAGLAF